MPSGEIIIAAAGGGKTTRIVERALGSSERSALVTYTNNNTDEIRSKLYGIAGAIPANIEVSPWYTFLLKECVRPYMLAVHDKPVSGFHFTNQKSARGVPAKDVAKFYFDSRNHIYSDKVSQFGCACDQVTKGAVMNRLAERFQHIYIDEVQDLAGYDLELVERILRSGIKVTLIGDHRQGTFRTNPSPKNSQFQGYAIIAKLNAWVGDGLATLEYSPHTHRCNAAIALFADRFYPDDPATVSHNKQATGHDGVFLVSEGDVESYREAFRPQVLRYSRATRQCDAMDPMNFGESKGLTFDRVLIYPHKAGTQWLASGDYTKVEKVAALLYVATTRARFSIAFVSDKDSPIEGVTRWKPGH